MKRLHEESLSPTLTGSLTAVGPKLLQLTSILSEESPLPPIQSRPGETPDVSDSPCSPCQSGGNPVFPGLSPLLGSVAAGTEKKGAGYHHCLQEASSLGRIHLIPCDPDLVNHRNWSRVFTRPPLGPVCTFHVPGVSAWFKDGHNHVRIIKANLRVLLELLERKSSFSWG